MQHTGPLAAVLLTGLTLACSDSTAPPLADSYQLRPALLTTVAGATDSLEVWAFADGTGWRTSASSWTVLDSHILTVSADGNVSALTPGWTTVRAAVGDTVLEAAVAVGVAFQALTSGDFHTCGLDRDGAAFCWGGVGEPAELLGAGRVGPSQVPVPVVGGLRFRALSAGREATCGLTTDDALHCWGLDDRGQLGAGTATAESCGGRACSTVPRPAAGGASYRMVSAGWGSQSCAIRADGAWVCWGREPSYVSSQAALCRPTPGNQLCRIPTPVAAGRWTVVATGREHACALNEAGEAWCMGNGRNGQLGTSSQAPCGWVCAPDPVRVPGLPALDTLVAAAHFTCGLSAPDRERIYCWGTSDRFPGSTSASPAAAAPFRVAREGAVSLGTWGEGVCAVSAGGGAGCWGSDVSPAGGGQPAGVPVPVDVSAVAGGAYFRCALALDGTVLCGESWLTPLPPPGHRPGQEDL